MSDSFELNVTADCAGCATLSCAKYTSSCEECPHMPVTPEEQQVYVDAYNEDGLVRDVIQAAQPVIYDSISEKRDRIWEIVEFCNNMGFKRIGIAACQTFIRETRILAEKLTKEGFEVVSTMCKTGNVKFSQVGLASRKEDSVVCNPLRQAQLLNEANTQLNVVLGLCIGHDAIFLANAKALNTPLLVKDRAHGHCPIRDFD